MCLYWSRISLQSIGRHYEHYEPHFHNSCPSAVESLNGPEVLSVTWTPHTDHPDEGVHAMRRMQSIQCHLSFCRELTSRLGHVRLPYLAKFINILYVWRAMLRHMGDSIRIRCSSGVHRCPSGIQLRFRTRIPRSTSYSRSR